MSRPCWASSIHSIDEYEEDKEMLSRFPRGKEGVATMWRKELTNSRRTTKAARECYLSYLKAHSHTWHTQSPNYQLLSNLRQLP